MCLFWRASPFNLYILYHNFFIFSTTKRPKLTFQLLNNLCVSHWITLSKKMNTIFQKFNFQIIHNNSPFRYLYGADRETRTPTGYSQKLLGLSWLPITSYPRAFKCLWQPMKVMLPLLKLQRLSCYYYTNRLYLKNKVL